MRFILTRQAGSVELQFMFADQCLFVNKILIHQTSLQKANSTVP